MRILLPLMLLTAFACSSLDAPGPATTPTAEPVASPTPLTTEPPPEAEAPGQYSVVDLVEYATPAIVRIAGGGSVGTGFVVDESGLIVTNHHVIERAVENNVPIEVTMSDGAVLQASVVGSDESSDIALLQIDPTRIGGGLTALPLAQLEHVIVGQEVVAIGFPLDLRRGEGASFSVTRGIVSAKNRQIGQGAAILGAIQTDASITSGNSGGPLLNLAGQVVGVNTAIALNTSIGGVAPGIGFAVGSDTVAAVKQELLAHGEVRRAYLGIQGFEAVRPAMARDLGMPGSIGGILVGGVAPDSPVGQVGVITGDVIVRIGQHNVPDEAALAVALILLDPGDTVDLVYYRDGERIVTTIALGDADVI